MANQIERAIELRRERHDADALSGVIDFGQDVGPSNRTIAAPARPAIAARRTRRAAAEGTRRAGRRGIRG